MDDALDRIEAAARRSVDHADPNTVAVMQRTGHREVRPATALVG
jgi:hypothetical protein